jgi:hypothetical protein
VRPSRGFLHGPLRLAPWPLAVGELDACVSSSRRVRSFQLGCCSSIRFFSVMLVALNKTPPPDGKEQFAWGLGGHRFFGLFGFAVDVT